MSSDIGTNPISMAIKATKLSRSQYQLTHSIDKVVADSKAILDYETNVLNMDRSVQSIGVYPSDLHSYELFTYASLYENKEETYAMGLNTFIILQIEMIIKLCKPKAMLYYDMTLNGCPTEYIQSLGIEKVYVPNDESLFRSENLILKSESPFEVVYKTDILNGILPENVDLIIINAVNLSMTFDLDVIEKIFTAAKPGSAILLYNNNDYTSYYANNSEVDEKTLHHPLYDVHEAVAKLENCYSYHIASPAGITVITKK